MQKNFFLTSLVMYGLFFTTAFAQDDSANPPISRSDASKEITKIHRDSQQNFLDQAKQISKSGPEAVQPPPVAEDDTSSTTPTNTNPNTSKQPARPVAPAAPMPTTPVMPPPPAMQQAPSSGNPAQAPANNQPYSGFGTGQSTQPAPASNNGGADGNKGSNWNMGY